MNKLSNRITAIAVLAFMFVFMLLTIFSGKADRSSDENRSLADEPVPDITSLIDGSYTDRLSTFAADHFAMRSTWLRGNAELRSQIGEGLINGVYNAGDMLLDADVSQRKTAVRSAYEINRFAGKYKGAIYVAAVPTSSGVYREDLPEYFDSYRESEQISDFYDLLDHNIKRIDAYNILKMLNDNYIYYRNDTKWTSYGAYCVYRTVIQKLGFLPTTYDKYSIRHVTSDFRGNLYNRSLYKGIKPDMIDIYDCGSGSIVTECTGFDSSGNKFAKQLYDDKQLDSDYMYNVYLGESVPHLRINTSVNNSRKLLVIKDSYADCFIPFLTQHYSQIDVIDPELITDSLSSYIDINDFEQTLFLFGIENLSREDAMSALNK